MKSTPTLEESFNRNVLTNASCGYLRLNLKKTDFVGSWVLFDNGASKALLATVALNEVSVARLAIYGKVGELVCFGQVANQLCDISCQLVAVKSK